MKTTPLARTLIVSAAVLAWQPMAARAVSLANLFGGQSITTNGYLFGNFVQTDLQTVNGGLVDTSSIDVTPFIGDSTNPGLVFRPTFTALGTPFGHSGLSSASLSFSFNLTPLSAGPPRIGTALMFIDGFTFDAGPNASIDLMKNISGDSGTLGTLEAMAHGSDILDPPSPELSSSMSFAFQNALHLTDHIFINGPGTNDGVRLTGFQQRFFVAPVPEPGTMVLMCLGVAMLLIAQRRRGS